MAALLIFLGTYFVVAFGRTPFLRIDRTAAAIVGAILMVAIAGLTLDAALLCWMFRRELHGTLAPTLSEPARPIHRAMVIKSVTIASATMAGFLAGIEPALVSASAAAALLVSRSVKPAKLYRAVDWDLLVLFIGLFVVIAGVTRAGLDARFFELLRPIGIDSLAGLTFVGATLSNVISNVPAVMLFTSMVPRLPDPRTSWLALAMSTTLAGNLTILGSIANLIVIEGARKRGVRIPFVTHLAIGVPVTIVTLIAGSWWLHAYAR